MNARSIVFVIAFVASLTLFHTAASAQDTAAVEEGAYLRNLLVTESDTPLTAEGIEKAWQARKAVIVGTIATLTLERRAHLVSMLDSVLGAMTAYAFDREHIRETLTEWRESYSALQNVSTIYARMIRETESRLDQKAKALRLPRDGMLFADKLWVQGGDPVLAAALHVGNDLRGELTAVASPRTDAQASADAPSSTAVR